MKKMPLQNLTYATRIARCNPSTPKQTRVSCPDLSSKYVFKTAVNSRGDCPASSLGSTRGLSSRPSADVASAGASFEAAWSSKKCASLGLGGWRPNPQ